MSRQAGARRSHDQLVEEGDIEAAADRGFGECDGEAAVVALKGRLAQASFGSVDRQSTRALRGQVDAGRAGVEPVAGCERPALSSRPRSPESRLVGEDDAIEPRHRVRACSHYGER